MAKEIENKGKFTTTLEDVKDLFLDFTDNKPTMDDILLLDKNAQIKDQMKEYMKEFAARDELRDYKLPTTRTLIFTGAPGLGKAVSLTTKKLMKDIKIGDIIFDGNGNKTKVLGVYPQGERQTYKIQFNDGTSIIVDEEHLNPFYQWKRIKSKIQIVNNKKKKVYTWGKKEQILTTKNLIKYFNECKKKHDKPLRIETPIIHFEEQKLELDPYILGILLGDGCITGNNTISFANLDTDIIYSLDSYCKLIGDTLKLTYNKKINKDKQCQYNIYGNNIKIKLSKYNLIGTYSDTKFIPKEFLFNSIENRIALLQGLMDTDGCCWNQKKIKKSGTYCGGYFEYLTVSKQLSENFAFLVRSLGAVDKITIKKCFYYDKDNNKKICKDGYRHYIRFPKNIIPFRCERKKANMTVKEFTPLRKIIAINKYKKLECQCIYVDSSKHTYIANDFIPTHNTFLAQIMATDLNVPLYIIDISSTLANKEVGLQNIRKIFDFVLNPKNQPCILFLDECDGIAQGRDNPKASLEDNRCTNYIMQVINEQNNNLDSNLIIIAASNFEANIDEAFLSRFQLRAVFYVPEHYTPYIKLQVKKNKMFTLIEDVDENKKATIDLYANKARFGIRELNSKILWVQKQAVIKAKEKGLLDPPLAIRLSDIYQQIANHIKFVTDVEPIKIEQKYEWEQ